MSHTTLAHAAIFFGIYMFGWLIGYWRGAVTMKRCMEGNCPVPWCENNPKKN